MDNVLIVKVFARQNVYGLLKLHNSFDSYTNLSVEDH